MDKFLNNLYYLNEECISLALFDDRPNKEIKGKMLIFEDKK